MSEAIVAVVCTISAIVLLTTIFLYFFPIVQIAGYSMFPTLLDGELYLGRRVFRKTKCKVGEIYVYRPPYDSDEERFVIKRLSHIEKDQSGRIKYYFLGDNSNDSYDSRYYGLVDSSRVVAHIVAKKRGVSNEGL